VRTGAFVSVAVALVLIFGSAVAQNISPSRDIDSVLRAHDKELLAIPGVVGVYIGVLDDGKTPCLKVMLAEKSSETERAIPKMIEGFPVVIEVTGQIRPLDK
jgi:predicted nucleotidyltransferase